jgi:hypothetical protein
MLPPSRLTALWSPLPLSLGPSLPLTRDGYAARMRVLRGDADVLARWRSASATSRGCAKVALAE